MQHTNREAEDDGKKRRLMWTPGVHSLLTSKEGGDKDANGRLSEDIRLGLVAAFSLMSGQDVFLLFTFFQTRFQCKYSRVVNSKKSLEILCVWLSEDRHLILWWLVGFQPNMSCSKWLRFRHLHSLTKHCTWHASKAVPTLSAYCNRNRQTDWIKQKGKS